MRQDIALRQDMRQDIDIETAAMCSSAGYWH